jgi:diacylglycerol kinase
VANRDRIKSQAVSRWVAVSAWQLAVSSSLMRLVGQNLRAVRLDCTGLLEHGEGGANRLMTKVEHSTQPPTANCQPLTNPGMSRAKKIAIKWGELLKSEGNRRATSFRNAFSGLRRLVTTERHFQIHLLAAACALILAALLGFSRVEWALLVVTIALVLVAEGVNSAIERTLDAITPSFHPLAKAAKDISAGAVLIAAIVSVITGLLLYVPKLWALFIGRH